MENVKFLLERPLWMLMLVPAVLILAVIFLTMKKERRRQRKTVISFALHGIVAVVLALLAAGFGLISETDRQSTVILADVSDSTLAVREDMTAFCESLLKEFPERNVKGVVLFGQDTVFVGTKNLWGKTSLKKADASGTDITSALYSAVKLMDRYAHKRIILLSDGKETSRDALYAARRLAEEGIRIDTVYFDTNELTEQEAQISSMSSVGGSYVGEDLTISLTVESNTDVAATVALYEGETLIEEKAVTLTVGENAVCFELTADTAGAHTYRAVLICKADTEGKNNEAFVAMRTYGRTSLLIIAKDPAEAEELKGVLSADAEVEVVSQKDAPTDLPTLCNYDGYYLMNVDARELPAELEVSLEAAVKLLGKSLCFVGGDQTFSKGNMAGTAYERILPLDYGASNNHRLIFLVIDVSGSMEDNNGLELAKVGAVKVMETMGAGDYVSVIAFAGNAQTVVKPMQMTEKNKEKAARAIGKITVGGGTAYTPALDEVERLLLWEMDESPENKHVLFLSDGEPTEQLKTIYQKVEDMHERYGIVLSTVEIRAGSDDRNEGSRDPSSNSPLKRMAQKAGGTYTLVTNVLDLPNIMVEQSETFSSGYAYESSFIPLVAVEDEITEGIAELPELTGYVGMHPKENTTVYLTSETGDPVYASWTYGEGTVTCFTTDLSAHWSQAFLAEEAGQTFIRNAQKAAYPSIRYDAALIPNITVDGSRVTITVQLPEDGHDCEVYAEITEPKQKRIQLDRISASSYEGNLTVGETGEYALTVTWRKRAQVVDQATAVFAVSYSGEYDRFREGDNTLLSDIATVTGGYLDASSDALTAVDMGVHRTVITFEFPLSILAVLLLLADIVIRRLTLADLRKFLGKRSRGANSDTRSQNV